ncbi:Heterokaryon incompatibility protein (HET) domain containing protein [Elaphomyces granulatus]
MDASTYTYQPLMGNGSSSIRLLTLLPGTSPTTLSCEINEVKFGRNGNGKQSRKLWIDAICIDQSNEPEKCRQIKLMKHIYGKAKQVVIWLGISEDDDSTRTALDLVLRAAARLRRETGQRMPQLEEIVPERLDAVTNARHGFPPIDQAAAWEPLAELFKREWFGRVWVFQESAMATAAIIKIDDFEVDWADLFKCLNIQAKNRVFTICTNSGIGSRAQQYQRAPMIFLLEATLPFFATKPKDRVLDILGLTLEEDEFEDDYELTTKQTTFYKSGPCFTSQYCPKGTFNTRTHLSAPPVVLCKTLPS